MEELLLRLWHNLVGRWSGPLNFRLLVQPTISCCLAIRAGFADARQGRPPFLWTAFNNPAARRELITGGWKDVGRVVVLAGVLDVVYQVVVHRAIHLVELLIVTLLLGLVPYVLVRGPANRICLVLMAWRGGVAEHREED